MIQKYYDSDCNLGLLDNKTIAVIGYGSQGHAHAQNLKDSGMKVVVGLRKSSASWAKAEAAGLTVMEVPQAAEAADVVMMLVPDELAADLYNEQVAPHMKEGDILMFAHGFNIHFNFIRPAKDHGCTERPRSHGSQPVLRGQRRTQPDCRLPRLFRQS